jgi:hypothetical protein
MVLRRCPHRQIRIRGRRSRRVTQRHPDLVDGANSDYSINEPASLSPGFHPDRLGGAHTVAELLARDGVYRSQFETGSPTVG